MQDIGNSPFTRAKENFREAKHLEELKLKKKKICDVMAAHLSSYTARVSEWVGDVVIPELCMRFYMVSYFHMSEAP